MWCIQGRMLNQRRVWGWVCYQKVHPFSRMALPGNPVGIKPQVSVPVGVAMGPLPNTPEYAQKVGVGLRSTITPLGMKAQDS
jgi:hypothetical protein